MQALQSPPRLPIRRFTLDEWHRMIEVGVLDEDEHIELLEGWAVPMTPQGGEHGFSISQLTHLLSRRLSDEYRVRVQLPLTLGNHSEPEPDVAVVLARDERAETPHPHSAILVVEVAQSSLRQDRTLKLRLYAQAKVVEVWIVDVAKYTVEVHRGPLAKAGRYRTHTRFRRDQILQCRALPSISLTVSDLFP